MWPEIFKQDRRADRLAQNVKNPDYSNFTSWSAQNLVQSLLINHSLYNYTNLNWCPLCLISQPFNAKNVDKDT